MNQIIISIILGIVEGFTEFLPISSTGHLILLNNLLSFTGAFANMFDIVIQLGAILSVAVFFRNKLIPFGFGKSKADAKETWDIWKKTIVAVIPVIIIGATIGSYIQERLFNPFVVAAALIVGGIALIIIEKNAKSPKIKSVSGISYMTAFYIGLIQCISMIPGTSRSAATIIGAMLLGLSRQSAAEFSFYLAIPTMVAASGYSLLKNLTAISSSQMVLLTIGFSVSFIVALIVISGFMKYITKRDFKPFGYYRILLGAAVLVYFGFLAA